MHFKLNFNYTPIPVYVYGTLGLEVLLVLISGTSALLGLFYWSTG